MSECLFAVNLYRLGYNASNNCRLQCVNLFQFSAYVHTTIDYKYYNQCNAYIVHTSRMACNPLTMGSTFLVLIGGYVMTCFTGSHIAIIINQHALASLVIPLYNIYIVD